MQAHTLGEVSVLGTVLLRVYSGKTFAIFIEIGLCLTEIEQKISWHSFFLRHGVEQESSAVARKPRHPLYSCAFVSWLKPNPLSNLVHRP